MYLETALFYIQVLFGNHLPHQFFKKRFQKECNTFSRSLLLRVPKSIPSIFAFFTADFPFTIGIKFFPKLLAA